MANSIADIFSQPDQQLLLHCARFGTAGYDHQRTIQLATKIADWTTFFELTTRQRMLPLVYKCFNTVPKPVALDSFRQNLHRLFQANAARNILLTNKLLAILDLFREHDILAVPYKGPVLAQIAYGAIELRNYHDLDLLVGKQDFFKARDLLVARGYRPQFELESGQKTAFFQSQNELTLFASASIDLYKHNIDLHWQLLRGFFVGGLDLPCFSANLISLDLEQRHLPGFSPEDTLLILAVHGGKHMWQELLWVCDLAHLLEMCPINWTMLINQARRLHVCHLLFPGLLLTKYLFASPIPDSVIALAQEKPVLTNLAIMFAGKILTTQPLGQRQKLSLFTQMRERVRDKIRYLVLYPIFLSFNDIKLVRLPPWLCFVYYLLRPIRVSRKWFFRIIHS